MLNVWCLACALGGTFMASKWGRKPTALVSQMLLVTCLFVIGGLTKVYTDDPNEASRELSYGTVAVMFLFQGFYSLAWTPLLYLYPPEVLNYSIRANGVALSSFMLNAFACVLVYVMPIGLHNIGWRMYMVNGSWDIVILGLIVRFPSLFAICRFLYPLSGLPRGASWYLPLGANSHVRRITGWRRKVARWRKSTPCSRARSTVPCRM